MRPRKLLLVSVALVACAPFSTGAEARPSLPGIFGAFTGVLGGVMGMLPGIGKMQKQLANAKIDEKMIGRQQAIISSMTKIERRRPELIKALAACKKQKAKLVIAKLDRLSRNLAFIATLMDSGVEGSARHHSPARGHLPVRFEQSQYRREFVAWPEQVSFFLEPG